jgi:putative transposase
MVQQYDVDVLNFVVTSNHVHLLLYAERAKYVSAALHFLQGTTAGDYNRRTRREGAFWRGRYHPTIIESGPHLGRCVFYIDLNMVRAGAVEHPVDWRAGGHHELSGARERCRIINKPRLIQCMGHDPQLNGALDHFHVWYNGTLAERLTDGYQVKESFWSEASAIGSEAFVSALGGVRARSRVEAVPQQNVGEDAPLYMVKLSSRDHRAMWARKEAI